MKKMLKIIVLLAIAVILSLIMIQICVGDKDVVDPNTVAQTPVSKNEIDKNEANPNEVKKDEGLSDTVDEEAVDWDLILNIPTQEAEKEANPENRMAHNIYVDPDLSATSGKFSGFMIDFKADKAGTATYWALCNWQMNKDDLVSKYDVFDANAGAYAGLQLRPDGTKAIMSFWEINYKDTYGNEKKIEAKRVYPSSEEEHRFGGEGEGTNYICDYMWEEGKWYRMYLNCYQNDEGRTFVEQWVADISAREWTLISRFDTGLYYSYFEGGMSQFMENYDSAYANETRTFEYCNICVREYGEQDWIAINEATLSVDTWWDNKKGNAVYGATTDRFFGIANGYGPDAFKKDEIVQDTFTVKTKENLNIPLPNGEK